MSANKRQTINYKKHIPFICFFLIIHIFSVDIFHLFLKAVEMEFEKKAIANKGDWFSNGEYLGAVNSIV